MYYYLNDDHTYRLCESEEWANQFQQLSENDKKHIACDVLNGKMISTVWIGTNTSLKTDPPMVFETMVFDSNNTGVFAFGECLYEDEYSSWDDALEGHQKAIKWVLNGCKDE